MRTPHSSYMQRGNGAGRRRPASWNPQQKLPAWRHSHGLSRPHANIHVTTCDSALAATLDAEVHRLALSVERGFDGDAGLRCGDVRQTQARATCQLAVRQRLRQAA